MKRMTIREVLGVLLVGVGGQLLLQSFGIAIQAAGIIWTLIFAAGGILLLTLFVRGPSFWWAAIAGFAAQGIAAVIGIATLAPQFDETWSGPLLLGSLSAGFWVIFFTKRRY